MSKREEYIEKLKAKLDSWNTELDRLENKIKELDIDKKFKYQDRIQELRNRREEVKQKIKEIQEASGDAWQDFRKGAEKAWQAFREGIENARAQFHKKDE